MEPYGSGAIDIGDIFALPAAWGTDHPFLDLSPGGGDGIVDASDLDVLLSAWGPCP